MHLFCRRNPLALSKLRTFRKRAIFAQYYSPVESLSIHLLAASSAIQVTTFTASCPLIPRERWPLNSSKRSPSQHFGDAETTAKHHQHNGKCIEQTSNKKHFKLTAATVGAAPTHKCAEWHMFKKRYLVLFCTHKSV